MRKIIKTTLLTFVFLFSIQKLSANLNEMESLYSLATVNSDVQLFDIIKKYGGDYHTPALNKAIENGDYNSAIILLEYGVDPNKRSLPKQITISNPRKTLINDGESSLEVAIKNNMISIIPLLVIKGADPYLLRHLQFQETTNAETSCVTTPIYLALQNNNLESLKALKNQNVSLNGICFHRNNTHIPGVVIKYTLLKYALIHCKHMNEIIDFLIENHATIE